MSAALHALYPRSSFLISPLYTVCFPSQLLVFENTYETCFILLGPLISLGAHLPKLSVILVPKRISSLPIGKSPTKILRFEDNYLSLQVIPIIHIFSHLQKALDPLNLILTSSPPSNH